MQFVKKVVEAIQSPAAAAAVKGLGAVATFGAGAVYVYNNALFNVQAGHAAIIYNRLSGLGDEIYDEGTHVKIPWFQRVVDFDIKSRPLQIVSPAGSKDLQVVNVAVRVLTHPSKPKIPEIYRQLGPQFDEKVLPSIVNEVVKAVVARYTAAELTTLRERVSHQITEVLKTRLFDFNLILDDFSIVHLGFSNEYVRAVEEKKVAQQEAERAKYHVLRAEQEKKAVIIRAQGDQTAAQLIGQAVQDNPGYMHLREIEIAKDIAKIMSHSQNRVMLDSNQLLLNLIGNEPATAFTAAAGKK